MPGQYTTESTQRKVQKAVRCTAYGKGFLFFLQIHITGGVIVRRTFDTVLRFYL